MWVRAVFFRWAAVAALSTLFLLFLSAKHASTQSTTPPLIINEFLADPAAGLDGDANGDGVRHSSDDEFIELANASGADLDISQWTISDAVGIRHIFPDGTILPADGAVVVFGGGSPSGSFGGAVVQTASTGLLGLNNTGDEITVRDASGTVVTSHVYGAEANDDQSLTRNPDITGDFFKHSEIPEAGGALFSPGTRLDGTPFGPPTNHPPVIDPIGDRTAVVGRELTFTVTASDPDNDSLTYSAENLPPGATFVNQVFAWTPTAPGIFPGVVFRVQDGRGGMDEETITLTAILLPAVVINEILADPAADLAGDANGDGTRDASDDEFVEIVNNDSQPVNLSGWTLSDATGVRHIFADGTELAPGDVIVVFGGGSPTGSFGHAHVVTASSGSLGLNNSGDSVILTDAAGNIVDAHTFGSEGNQDQSLTRNPDITGEFTPHAAIPEAGGALFSPGTRVDGSPFPGVANQPPVLEPIGDRAIQQGQRLTFTVTAVDPDGDALTYTAENLPPGATFVNQVFDWTPAAAGTFADVRFRVTDGFGGEDEERITIVVQPAVLSIAEIRRDDDGDGIPNRLGQTVTAEGVITTPNLAGGSGIDYFFQDATGGMRLVQPDLSLQLTPGTRIRVTGQLAQVNGSERLVPDTGDHIEVVGMQAIPLPRISRPQDFNESLQGQRVFLAGLSLLDPSSFPAPGMDGDVQARTRDDHTVILRIDGDTEVAGMSAPPGLFSLVAVVIQDDPEPPFTTGYLLLPTVRKDIADFLVTINEVLTDPPAGDDGDANGDGHSDVQEDQFVELLNLTGDEVNLDGYILEVSGTLRHQFPQDSRVLRHEAAVVFGGGSPQAFFGLAGFSGLVQTASSGALQLPVAGGLLLLRNPSGGIVDMISYGSEAAQGQSLSRDPEGEGPFKKHTEIAQTFGARFSPGYRADGATFLGFRLFLEGHVDDVADKVDLILRNVHWNDDHTVIEFEAALHNDGKKPILTPLVGRIRKIKSKSQEIRFLNADGGGDREGAFYNYTRFVGDDFLLTRNETSGFRAIQIANPEGARFKIRYQILTLDVKLPGKAAHPGLTPSEPGPVAEFDIDFDVEAQIVRVIPLPAEENKVPAGLSLAGAYPNPFNPATTVRFSLPEKRVVDLVVFDVRGVLVRRLFAGSLEAGEHELRWDGRDDSGKPVASGLYLLRLQAGGEVRSTKLLLAR